MNTTFEKNKLYNYLGKDLVSDLKKYNAIVAGGTITSLFCNRDINDIDVYFRSEEETINFITEVFEDWKFVVSCTNKAIQFVYDDVNVQAIYFKYFDNAEDIFNTFDYTVCMGAYDFKSEEFILHNDFMKHNSQRILKFNDKTAFPIVSLLRVHKYEDKGYKISKPEFIRVALSCMNLDINSYDELKEHLGGMYGINLDKLFEDVDNEEFNLQDTIDVIADITLSDDYFVKPTPIEFKDVDDIIDMMMKQEFKAIKLGDNTYRVMVDNSLKQTKNTALAKYIDAEEFFKDKKIYKFVRKNSDGTYSSHRMKSFIYKLNEEVEALKTDGIWGYDGKLYFVEKNNLKNSIYYNAESNALIEATFKASDVIEIDEYEVLVKKAFITREVSESEWKEWIK